MLVIFNAVRYITLVICQPVRDIMLVICQSVRDIMLVICQAVQDITLVICQAVRDILVICKTVKLRQSAMNASRALIRFISVTVNNFTHPPVLSALLLTL